jgi:hypothetical protein
MQRKGVLDSVGPYSADLDHCDAKSDAPAINQQISAAVEIKQPTHCLI